MVSDKLSISTKHLVRWFDALRKLDDSSRTRALDAFWSGQIDSKAWLVNVLNSIINCNDSKNVYVFGGWIGLLSNMLLTNSSWNIGKIRSIDIDPWCESIADVLNTDYVSQAWKFKAVTADMGEFSYDWDLFPDIVINTSSEHVDQNTYDCWWDKIPCGSFIVIQGNNYNTCGEHIRCTDSLAEFKRINHIIKPLWEGSLKTNTYIRYMAISLK